MNKEVGEVSADIQIRALKETLKTANEYIISLKEELKRERECVDFYADRSNWRSSEYTYIDSIEVIDLELISNERFYHGGKLAREVKRRRILI